MLGNDIKIHDINHLSIKLRQGNEEAIKKKIPELRNYRKLPKS